MRIFWLSILLGLTSVSSAFGQRDAPVSECYLPKVSIYHDEIGKRDALTVDLLFKKNGGPYEHIEHQAYILVYLAKDEAEVLRLASDPQLTRKKPQSAKRFLEVLIDKKLIVPLESKVAKLNSPNGRTPRFPDASGNPERTGIDSLAAFSFPFKFTFIYEDLFHAVQQLGNFRSDNVTDSGSTKWFEDTFKLMVFVPVNDSGYATKVSSELRTKWDFANGMDGNTAILYFRPLPYEFSLSKFREKTLLLYIN
jgi:hypothetical protein